MAMTAAQVVVGSTVAFLNSTETDTVSGSTLIVKNTHATDALILGPVSVTAGTGFSLAAGATLTVRLGYGDVLWAIRGGSNDITAHVLRLDV